MPVAEKRIFRRWVLWAVKVIWEGLGWSEWYVPPQQQNRIRSGDYRTSPLVRCDWDEASCSQLVLLYNELTVKQHGDAHHLFRLMGKKRARYSDHPCVRIASIDIAGGTTDLVHHHLRAGQRRGRHGTHRAAYRVPRRLQHRR